VHTHTHTHTCGHMHVWFKRYIMSCVNDMHVSPTSCICILYPPVFIHVHIYTYIRIKLYKHVHVYIYAYIRICIYICIHIYIHKYTYIHIYICTYIPVYIYTCIHIYMCTYIQKYIPVSYLYTSIYTSHIPAYIHTNMIHPCYIPIFAMSSRFRVW